MTTNRFEERQETADIIGKPITKGRVSDCAVRAFEMGFVLSKIVAFDRWTAERPSGDFFGHFKMGTDEELKRLGEAEQAVKDKLLAQVDDVADGLDLCFVHAERELFLKRVADFKKAVENNEGNRDVQIMARRVLEDFV